MQRRAAAVYFALFLVLGGGAYGYMQVGMSQPTVDLDAESLSEGDELVVDGRTYTVTSVSAETEEGSTSYGGELTWYNESNVATATLDNGSTVAFRDGTYAVSIDNETDSFALVEQFNVSARLANDPDVEDETLTRGDREYVRYRDGTTRLLEEYLPDRDTATYRVGDEYVYPEENATTTVSDVSPSAATLSWNQPTNQTVEFAEGENITLNGQPYFAHFPSDESVQVLPRDDYYASYTSELSDIDYYQTRVNGMWGIVIISLLAGIVLLATAYLPHRG